MKHGLLTLTLPDDEGPAALTRALRTLHQCGYQHEGERVRFVALSWSGGRDGSGPPGEEDLRALQAVWDLLEHDVISVTLARGRLAGRDLWLALASQIIIVGPHATVGFDSPRGDPPPPIALPLLTQRLHPRAARALLVDGRVLTAEEALELGVVDHLGADPEALLQELLPRMASQHNGYVGIRQVERAWHRAGPWGE